MRGMSVGRIAVSCEIDESTLYRWRHEDEEFVSQTIYLSGHAFIRCRFDRCTFVVTNMPFVLMHNQPAGHPATVSALPVIIRFFRAHGYRFVRV